MSRDRTVETYRRCADNVAKRTLPAAGTTDSPRTALLRAIDRRNCGDRNGTDVG
jgi:hypothetical protein